MIVGMDVTHPAPKSMLGTPSIASVVASVDGMYGQWPGSIRCQTSRQESLEALDIMMKERLALWKKTNNKLPERILIYRDGVSEGQYTMVLTDELDQILKLVRFMGRSQPQRSPFSSSARGIIRGSTRQRKPMPTKRGTR